jgi:hypothetical protein
MKEIDAGGKLIDPAAKEDPLSFGSESPEPNRSSTWCRAMLPNCCE